MRVGGRSCFRGFLGSTVGVTADGTFFAFARFADEAAAKANSARPEQSAWWEETVKIFEGEPTFTESSDVATLFDGGSDSARFVQVMEGTGAIARGPSRSRPLR